ncbi:UDP-N-acetylglucosamine transferase subunit ALG13 homolog [Scaptodrosophila lebanonensis]|uniref:UDP-N-acetylglucosamine transferase subunit ALG13 n=1 Tax=Drosophila lebanonensis TaxID=7225 RepID=A0A6J2SX70_DROLE|nr:UDP-N-acetylglucosamine transferase subunit ALG13 homolog [Scaptodrosophila lebanonensis]
MNLAVVYVTVGTTKFDALTTIMVSDTVLEVLKKRQCQKLVLQQGNSLPVELARIQEIEKKYGIKLEQYSFRPNLSDIREADLIIGHAGAGTCLDILENGKAGLIVVNDELMDNHQMELAQQLADEQYLYYCRVNQVPSKLSSLDFNALKPYERGTENMRKFVSSLAELMC